MNTKYIWVLISIVFVFSPGCKKETVDRCGDGVLDPGEECDGTEFTVERCQDLGFYEQNGDLTCKKDCTLDQSVCASLCGDGIIQSGFGELCDGDSLNGESCQSLDRGGGTLQCRTDCMGWDFSGCEIQDLCGNLQVDDEEECDGEDLADQTCESLGFRTGDLVCLSTCRFDVTGCGGKCGDGIIQPEHEECDLDDVADTTCRDYDRFTGKVSCTDTCTLDGENCQTAMSIEPGHDHTCALLWPSRSISCWGDNTYGQLGNGTQTNSLGQVILEDFDHAVSLSSGYHHTCAVHQDGVEGSKVFCWGRNLEGQLGDGTQTDSSIPLEVDIPEDILQVSAFSNSTCALTVSGKVWCWGNNEMGQLGDGSRYDRFEPVEVDSRLPAVENIAVGYRFACARTAEGKIWCWGDNTYGQLGHDPALVEYSEVPVELNLVESDLEFVYHIVVGCEHTCVIGSGSQMYCWGRNPGIGSMTSTYEPIQIGMPYVASMSAGCYHTCAIGKLEGDLENRMYCWGDNTSGEIGQETGDLLIDPTLVHLESSIPLLSVHAKWGTSCVLIWGGESGFCWGDNSSGQLGGGNTSSRELPLEIQP